MTKAEKEKVIIDWWDTNYNQLKINVIKVCGYSPAAIDKWGSDIIPYAYETFRKMNLDRQYDIITEGNPENYITRGMALSIKSSTSMFYNTYRKFSRKSNEFNTMFHDREDYETKQQADANIVALEKAVKKLDFYDSYLINEYYINNKTGKEISKVTGIAQSTVSRDIKIALKKLKKLLNGKVDFK